MQGAKGSFENPQLSGAELRPLIAKAHDDLNPLRIRQLLRAIPDGKLLHLHCMRAACALHVHCIRAACALHVH